MLKIITQPATEVVTLAKAKAHLRVDISDDDDLIADQLKGARQWCEEQVARSFITTSWRLTADHFPYVWVPGLPWNLFERDIPGTVERIKIPRGDLIAVSSITYVDSTGSTVTLDPSLYTVSPGAPGRVVPAYGRTWPTTRCHPESVTIDFTVGYGSTADLIPCYVTRAVLLLLGDLYRNRESSLPVKLSEAPNGVQRLLAMADWGGGYA